MILTISRLQLITLLILLFCTSSVAQKKCTLTLPEGLRLATSSDYSSVNPLIMGKAKPQIKADFDGNKLEDLAALVVSKEGSGFGLYVFLQVKRDEWKTITLSKFHTLKNDHVTRYGLLPFRPGHYKTYCYHQPESCGADQPRKLTIEFPSFMALVLESHSAVYYWDKRSKTFKSAPMSD